MPSVGVPQYASWVSARSTGRLTGESRVRGIRAQPVAQAQSAGPCNAIYSVALMVMSGLCEGRNTTVVIALEASEMRGEGRGVRE